MNKLNRWIRRLHRWLVIPFLLAIIYLIVGSVINGRTFIMPALLNVMAIGSLLSLLLTGAYMFAQHYWAKWRRAR
jgi:predicted transporter